MRIFGDEKTLNIGLLCLEKKACRSGSTCRALAGRAEVVQAAVPTCNGQQQQQSPTGRSAVYPALLDARCASDAASTTRSPSFLFVGLSAREGILAAKIRSEERGGKGARACSSGTAAGSSTVPCSNKSAAAVVVHYIQQQ